MDYIKAISDTEAKYDLKPGVLKKLIEVESGGNLNARSPKGALGLTQLMPETAKEMGVDPNDPLQNIEGGARYLKQGLDKFNGNYAQAIAGYNAGHNNKAVEAMDYNALPNETKKYANQFLDFIVSPANADETPYKEPLTFKFGEQAKQAEPLTFKFAEPKETPSRIASLGGRAVLEGVAGIPGGVYNLASTLSNLRSLLQKKEIPETNKWGVPRSIDTQQYGTKLADYFGLQQPSESEQKPMEYARLASGLATGGLGIKALGSAIPAGIRMISGANAPVVNVVGGLGGKAGSEIAGGMIDDSHPTLKTIAQIVGGVVGGSGSSGLASMVKPTSRTVLRAGQSVAGQLEPLAGRLLNRQAGEEADTVAGLLEGGGIPGVNTITDFKPKTSDIAGNAGISSLARFVENDPNASTILSERLFNNAKSLKDYINTTVGSSANIAKKEDYLYKVVDTVSKPMRDRNLQTNIDNVVTSIDDALLKNKGNPAIEGALQSIKEKMPQGDVGFNEVYNFKQYIDDALRGKYDDPASLQIAKSGTALSNVKKELAASLGKVEPEFGQFLKTQAVGIRQLNQSKQAEQMIGRATNKTPIVSNRTGAQEEVFPLSAANLKTQTLNEKAMSKLSPNQRAIFENAQNAATAGTRGSMGIARASNTMQNAKMNDLIADDVTRAFLGSDVKDRAGILSNVLRPVTKGLSNVTGRTGEIADILARAELDPQYAAMLMRKYKLSGPVDMKSAAGRNALYGALTQYQNK